MLELAYSSQILAQMTAETVNLHMQALLVKIAVINGWMLPDDEQLLNIYYDQTYKFLVEHYTSLNIDEIEYALRTYGTQIQDWGKVFNLSMLYQALDPYMKHKVKVQRLEKALRDKEPTGLPVPETNWGGMCEICYDEYKRGIVRLWSCPWEVYDELVKAGYMSDWRWTVFYRHGRRALLAEKAKQDGGGLNLDPHRQEPSEELLIFWAKRVAVYNLFKIYLAAGVEHFFVKVED